jgi:uncharacterized protein YlxW (UPF0749 family)
LLVAAVFAAAVAQARSMAPDARAEQRVLRQSVRSAQSATDALAARRSALATRVDDLQRRQLAANTAASTRCVWRAPPAGSSVPA